MREIPELIILCREVDKYAGRPTIIYKIDVPIESHTLKILSLRSRYNPELMYFVTLKSNYEENKEKVEKYIMNLAKYDEFNSIMTDGREGANSFLEENGILML